MLKQNLRQLRAQLCLDHHKKPATWLPLILFAGITLALILLNQFFKTEALWADSRSAIGFAEQFCEAARVDFAIKQPSNTWSNLGFLLVGLFCLVVGLRDYVPGRGDIANCLVRYPMFSILIGSSLIILFFGSFMFHASLNLFFQSLDRTGMYAVLISFMSYSVYRFIPLVKNRKGELISTHHFIIGFCLVALTINFCFFWQFNPAYVVGILVVLMMGANIMFAIKRARETRMLSILLFSLLSFFAALSIWLLDFNHVVCSPSSVLQGHALWHLLCAVSLFLIYLSYRAIPFLPVRS